MNDALTVTTHEGAHLPIALVEDSARQALWNVDRQLWAPRTLTVVNPASELLGAVLTSGRPYSAYRKVVDIVATTTEVFALLLREVQSGVADLIVDQPMHTAEVEAARRPQPIVVHLEEHFALAPFTNEQITALESAGFVPQPQPVPSIPSTRPDHASGVGVWTWWRNEKPTRMIGYYGQTTEVTCGAVAALDALEHLGLGQFTPDSMAMNREVEIDFWRRATNLPACDPIALAVETARAASGSELLKTKPQVIISAPDYVLLEEYLDQPSELMLRTDLQRESLRQAEQLELPIERRWIDVDEIFDVVRQGSLVFLLIGLNDLIGDMTPHWVLAYDVIDEQLLLSDPWVQYPNGETWADTYALPLPAASVDLVTRWGDPAYRAVIILDPSGSR